MTVYYNDNDRNCTAWLRELIKEKIIAPGDVDDQDIRDVRPVDLAAYTQCHFFAGIGGWSLALRLAGVGDHEEVWTGSCPCQPFSAAGKRGGFADERHLWPSFYHLIAQCRPPKLFGEQVASAADWLRLVRGDLEALDYAVGAIPIEAASAGADHLRDRFWFVADDGRGRFAGSREGQVEQPRRTEAVGASNSGDVGNADSKGPQGRPALPECADQRATGTPGVADANSVNGRRQHRIAGGDRSRARPESDGACEWVIGSDGKARRVKSGVRLLAHGVPSRVGLLRGFGNAIDPRPAAAFIKATL